MLLINDVNITPNPVGTNEKLLISVTIITWDYLRANYTWDSLKNSGETCESLRNKAVKIDFSSTWNSVKEKYTCNSLKRYGVTWDDLKGEPK